MKIAIASINLEAQGGGNRQILILAKELQKLGNQVVIYSISANRGGFSGLQKGLDLRIVPAPEGELEWKNLGEGIAGKVFSKIRHYRQSTKAARRIAEAMDPDFDAVNPHDYAYQVAYFYKKRNPSAREVWTMNEPPYIHLKKENALSGIGSAAYSRIMDMTGKKFMRAIDCGVVLAPRQGDWLIRRGIQSKLIMSGVDFKDFYSPVKKLPRGFSREPLRLLTIGTPNKYRRYEDAIEAVRILRDRRFNGHLTVVANNIWRENEYCGMLEDLVKRYHLEKSVDLNFDGVPEEKLRQLYRESHIFLHNIHVPPMRSGSTQGLVMWEAMAAGLLVVASHEPKFGSLLSDGKQAVFVKPEDPADLADKIEMIAREPERYFEIATVGQRFVRENLSWERYAKEMTALFEK